MFEYILKNKHNTYAYDNQTGINTFQNTKNIDEIIKTCNNIEELETLYSFIEDNFMEANHNLINNISKKSKNILYCLLIVILFPKIITLAIFMILATINSINSIKLVLKKSKIDKEYLEKIKLIDNALTKEKNNLENFKKTDKIITLENQQKKISLNRSELIESLYNKLNLIEFYIENEKKLKILNAVDNLQKILSSSLKKDDIEFIEYLINNKTSKDKKLKYLKK